MGSPRPKPKRLAEKLLQIRTALGISQPELFNRLGVEHLKIDYTKISTYETGKREPPLQVLLQYARVANVLMEVLADDELDLPETIPSPTRSEGIQGKLGRSKKR